MAAARVKLGTMVGQIRFYLDEDRTVAEIEGEISGGEPTYPRTTNKNIAACLVRAMLRLAVNNPQAVDTDAAPDDGTVFSAIFALAEGDYDAEAVVPIKPEYVPAVEENALQLINLRDQQGYRPEVANIVQRLLGLAPPQPE